MRSSMRRSNFWHSLETICLSSAMMTSLSIVFAVQSRRLCWIFRKIFRKLWWSSLQRITVRRSASSKEPAGWSLTTPTVFRKAHMASAETERRSQSLSFRIRQWRLWRLSKKCRICCETEESRRRSQFCSGRIPEHVFIWKNSWNTTSRFGCGTDCRIFTNNGSQTICLLTYALQTEIAAGKIFCRS